MGKSQRRLARPLHTLLLLVVLLSLCAGPFGLAVALAEAPRQAATPYRFQPWPTAGAQPATRRAGAVAGPGPALPPASARQPGARLCAAAL